MIEDATLLRRYIDDGSEEAFAELVQRHLPLVYSAALRRLAGDAHRAQDVAQVVFCALARNARKVSRQAALAGWLYTATRYAVTDVVRSEVRRRRREQEAHIMQEITEPDTPADWSQLRPVLDAAMDRLSERDREAVLLRYFQGMAFAEIGALLGVGEDGARKRVDRALDKLRVLLRPQGIGSTGAALAALLGSQAAAAVPPALATNIAGTALASATTVSGLTAFFSLTKLQAVLAGVVIAGGAVGLVVQQRTISGLRTQEAKTQEQVAALAADNQALARRSAQTQTEVARLRVAMNVGEQGAAEASRRQTGGSRPQANEVTAGAPIVIAPGPGAAPAPGAADGLSAEDEARFPHFVPVKMWPASEGFQPGDAISIRIVRGDRPRLEIGGTYLVQGEYRLSSAPTGRVGLMLTTRNAGPVPVGRRQNTRVMQGAGTFTLVAGVQATGDLHVSFYLPNGRPGSESSRGGIYFTND